MDNFLQRQICPNFYHPRTNRSNFYHPSFVSSSFRLPASPANNYITPGIGQITKLYSFYIPTHRQKPTHSINKEIHSNLNQEGSGNEETELKR
jgi:hypothetical protein